MEVEEEGTRWAKPTQPKHHRCHECRDVHAGSYTWNWTDDWKLPCQSCWRRHQEQELARAAQMLVPDDDPMDIDL